MKTHLLGTICLGLWLAALPINAQTPNRSRNPEAPSRAAAPVPHPPQAPATTPEEKSHRAMVEEQERRDRKAEAERDRDDL